MTAQPMLGRLPRLSRRTAKIELSTADIANLLGLPERYEVVAVRDSFDPVGIIVMVEGEGLEPVRPGCESPLLPLRLLREMSRESSEPATVVPATPPAA